jgi:nucleotide-binding universal stress UspA family protein
VETRPGEEIVMGTKQGQYVVVGVDGSDSALRAVRWAADEAARRRAPLRLVTAFGWTDDLTVGLPGLGTRYRDILLDQSRRGLATAVATAREGWPELEISDELRIGYPIGTLAAEARKAQLLVVGDRGLNRVEGVLLGSVGVAMAAHSACPAVIVRGAEPIDSTRPIVVGVDSGPVSEAAVAFAFQAAADRSTSLIAVHTWWDSFLDQSPAVLFRDEDQAYEQEQLAQRLAGWSEKYPQVQVTPVVTRDRAVHQLLERSREAQLVVVGSRGHGELAGLVLGSVSNALVHNADCPVAIVRPTSVERG